MLRLLIGVGLVLCADAWLAISLAMLRRLLVEPSRNDGVLWPPPPPRLTDRPPRGWLRLRARWDMLWPGILWTESLGTRGPARVEAGSGGAADDGSAVCASGIGFSESRRSEARDSSMAWSATAVSGVSLRASAGSRGARDACISSAALLALSTSSGTKLCPVKLR